MHHIIILLLCIVILIASLVFKINGNDTNVFGFKWPLHCLLYKTLGVKCALCGLSRSFCSLAHGDFLKSLRFHTIGPAIFIFVCLQIPYRIWAIALIRRKINATIMKIGLSTGVLLVAALFVNWLIYLGGLFL